MGDECTLELERYNGKFLKPWSCALGRTFANCAYVQITIVERNLNQIQDAFDAEAEQQAELLTSSDPDNPCLPNPCVGDGSECTHLAFNTLDYGYRDQEHTYLLRGNKAFKNADTHVLILNIIKNNCYY